MLRRAFDWYFRDRETGRIVLAQFPNPSLWIAIGLLVARMIWPLGWLDVAFRVVMAWWAGRELLQGVTPFRRTLGFVVLVGIVGGLITQSYT